MVVSLFDLRFFCGAWLVPETFGHVRKKVLRGGVNGTLAADLSLDLSARITGIG
jgi:hypothetical protein